VIKSDLGYDLNGLQDASTINIENYSNDDKSKSNITLEINQNSMEIKKSKNKEFEMFLNHLNKN